MAGNLFDNQTSIEIASNNNALERVAQAYPDVASLVPSANLNARDSQTYIEIAHRVVNTPPGLSLACPSNNATVGAAYSSTFVATGGTPPYTFSIISGTLPTGLNLTSSTGAVTGTPTAEGNFTYTGQVVDSLGANANTTCTINVTTQTAGANCTITIAPLPPPVVTDHCRTTLYLWQLSRAPQVETITDRFDDWSDCGSPLNKFFQGFLLDADTFGAPKMIGIRDADTGTLHPFSESPIVHAGRQRLAYSFDTPFLAHMVRRESEDQVPWRVFDITYHWEPTPESVETWTTQWTAHGLKGYMHVYRIEASYASTAAVTLQVSSFDGQGPLPLVLPSTGGATKKVLLTLSPNKGQLYQYSATSPEGFQMFENDFVVHVGAWGRTAAYLPYRLVGGQFGDNAQI